MSLIIKFKLLYPDSKPPIRAVSGDAGWDLSVQDLSVHRGNDPDDISGVHMFYTGVAVEIPHGYFGLLRPRSSICKTSYTFASSGIIDSGYRGEIAIPMRWTGKGTDCYAKGERIAQLVILPLPDVTFVQVDKLSESERGVGGFGSTGQV